MRTPRFPMLLVVALAVLTIFGSCICFAQSDNASISGRITDPSGAIVTGVQVQLQSTERGETETTVSNENGIYVFPFVRPGLYNLTVRKSGFRQIDFVGLTVNTQDHIEQNFSLILGAASESITVTAEGNRVETSGATATSVDQIMVAAHSNEDIPAAIQQLNGLLRERHRIHAGELEDFSVRDMT